MMKKKKVRPGYWRTKWYMALCEEDGEECRVCHKKPPEVYLEVDAIDGNHKHDWRSNVQLLCRSCNRRKDPRGKGRRKYPLSSSLLEQPKPATAEMAKHLRCQPVFVAWLEEEVRKCGGWILLEDAVNSGAAVADLSVVTIRRYLSSMASKKGKYQIPEDTEPKIIGFRHPESIGILNELEENV
jgi:hypothetical protein